MIECARGYGCLTCFVLLFSGPMVVSLLSLHDGAMSVRAGHTCTAVRLYNTWWVGGSLRGRHCCTTYCFTAVSGRVDRIVAVVCCGRVSTASCFFVFVFVFLPLYRPRAGIVQRPTSMILIELRATAFAENTCSTAVLMYGDESSHNYTFRTDRTYTTVPYC